MSWQHALSLFAISAMFGVIGCGPPPAAAVYGKVTLDGEPVANGSIVFLPPSGTRSKAAAAITEGAYAVSPQDKLLPGTYRVEISWRKATGKKIPSADPGMTIDETREAVPAKFNTDSTLTAEVGSGDVVKDFNLTTK